MSDAMELSEAQQTGAESLAPPPPEAGEEIVPISVENVSIKVPKSKVMEYADRARVEIQFLTEILENLESEVGQCRVSQIFSRYEIAIDEIDAWEVTNGRVQVATGFFGIRAMTIVCAAVFKNMNAMLADTSSMVDRSQVGELCRIVSRCLDPSFKDSPLLIVPYSEFLRPHSDILANVQLLGPQELVWIKRQAQVGYLARQRAINEGQVSEDQAIGYVPEMQHYLGLMHGSFPYGFSIATESRYTTLDLEKLLVANGPDPLEELRGLDHRQVNYAKRMASELLAAIGRGEIQPKKGQTEHLQSVMRGEYPHGFHERQQHREEEP